MANDMDVSLLRLPNFIADRIEPEPNSGCWLWRLSPQQGYGVVWDKTCQKNRKAHRVVYELLVSPIPSGLQIDHRCRVRACVNPAHLDVVTSAENTKRSPIAPAVVNARKTHCLRGHEFTPDNIVPLGRWRTCRACRREINRRYNRRRRPNGER